MIYRYVKNCLIFIIFFFFASYFVTNASNINGIDVDLEVGTRCNNNGVCNTGEDMYNCPADCIPEEPTDKGKTGSIVGEYFKNLKIEVSYNKVTIKWESTIPTT